MTVSLIVERGPVSALPYSIGQDLSRGQPSNTTTAPPDGRSALPHSTTAPQTNLDGRPASPYSTLGNAAKSEYAHLSPLQRRILEFIANQPPSDEGVNVGNIAKAVAGHDAHQIRYERTTTPFMWLTTFVTVPHWII